MLFGPVETMLLLLILLQAKHFVCDGPLQTADMVRDKGFYGRRLGLLHAGIHGLGTFAAFLIWGEITYATIALLAGIDALLHYHIDFTKEQFVRRNGWTTSAPQFWWSLSADQMLHQLTYLLLAWLALKGV